MGRFDGNWETRERRNFRRVLVVGGGRAGVASAEELRRQGFGGEILVMCDEPDAPYDRPSCSKGLLNGRKRPRDAKMPVQEDLAIQWALGRRAVNLDAANRVVYTDTNEKFNYDGLVIATGAHPIWPKDWPPLGEPGLHQLWSVSDAWKLRQALQRARRVAIVGGGLTGCEVACTIRALARDCVLIDSKQQVMTRALGEVVGRYVTEEVERDGVQLRLGRRVKAVDRSRKGWVVSLDDGSEEVADLVIGTIGERPEMDWLADSGFDTSDGVLCDEHLRVVGGEDVVACGTVARWPNLLYSTKPRRVGQWIMALEQGRAAAATLLRSDHPARPAKLVPRYWSEQFGLRIQVCGEIPTDGSAEMTVSRQRPGRKDTARAGVLIGYYRQGEQIGLVGVNATRAFTTTARMMLASPPRRVEEQLAHQGPPMLEAAPAGAPHRERLAIGAGPASAPPPDRFVIDAPPDAVHHHGYGPVPGDEHSYGYGQAPPGAGYEAGPASGRHSAEPSYGYDPLPAYGQPAYAQPAGYGQPEYGPTGYGQPGYPPPSYDEPTLGGGSYGPPAYREPLAIAATSYEPPPPYGEPPAPYGERPDYQEPPPAYGEQPPPGYGYPPPGYAAGPPDGYGYPPEAGQGYPPPGYQGAPPPGYEAGPPPGYGEAPAYQGAAPGGYGPPEPGYGPGGAEPGYGPPGYEPAGHGPVDYGPPQYGPPQPGPGRYGPAEYGPAEYAPPEYGAPRYTPEYSQAGHQPQGYPPEGYEPGGYEPAGPPGYGQPAYGGQDYGPPEYPPQDYGSPAPVSPPVGPPPPRLNPRDRFATDQFAAVR